MGAGLRFLPVLVFLIYGALTPPSMAAPPVIVNPPVTAPFTATVINRTPPNWHAVIKGVVIELHFDDHSTESLNDPAANIATGGQKSYSSHFSKCVAYERVALNIVAKDGQHIIDKPLSTAPKCLAHADHLLAPAPAKLRALHKNRRSFILKW
jgi:hypothetical protein